MKYKMMAETIRGLERKKPNRVLQIIGATTLALSAIISSHAYKASCVDCEVGQSRVPAEESIEAVMRQINAKQYRTITDPKGFKFIVGDFDTKSDKIRCGGAAKIFCEELAERGFTTELHFSLKDMHYYGTAKKDGKEWILKNSPPKASAELQTYSPLR